MPTSIIMLNSITRDMEGEISRLPYHWYNNVEKYNVKKYHNVEKYDKITLLNL